jgi:hypothetical protein
VQLGEHLYYRQPEPSAFELSRQAGIDLTEWFEQPLQSFGVNADAAIDDANLEKFLEAVVCQRQAPAFPGARELTHISARDACDAHRHLAALVGEFDGVG